MNLKWKLEPMLTKNVVMFCIYTKGDQSLTHAIYYRWGEAIINTPVLTDYDEEVGINIKTLDDDICYELHDCYYSRIIKLSNGIPKHIKTSLRKKLFVEDYDIRELEDDGWSYYKHEIWFHGTLQIELEERERCRD